MSRVIRYKKSKNKLRFFTNTVYSIFIGLLFIVLFLLGLNIIINNGNVKESYILNKRPTICITNSMEPTVMVNGVVVLEPITFEDIEIGDIIRYSSQMGYDVLHRVIEKEESYVITKGDNNNNPDRLPVFPEQIKGKVTNINNDIAPFLTLLFGRFEYGNFTGSIVRFCIGLLIVCAFIVILIVFFILLFEMISITLFFVRKKTMVDDSEYWLEDVKSLEENKEFVEKYNKSFSEASIFKKIVMAYRFRRWYNGMCNMEKEVLKTKERLNAVNKLLDR